MKISEIRAIVNSHLAIKPFVAVFAGGTQGIGHYTIRVLASICCAHKVSLRAYIIGRAKAKADNVISECLALCPDGKFTFVPANDLTSIVDVDRVSERLQHIENNEHASDKPRIDLLCLTQGQVLFGPRQETAEGLDRSMSLLYYSRVRLIMNLMPLLEAAEQSHVISVYAAGMEGKLYQDDLSLRDPTHYSFMNCRSHVIHMKTLAFEHIAQEHPSLSLTHIFPGLVIGPGIEDPTLPWWFKVAWRFAGPFASLMATKADDAGYTMLLCATGICPPRNDPNTASDLRTKQYDSTDHISGGGSYALGGTCDEISLKVDYRKLCSQGFQQTVWKHTLKAFDDIVTNGRFTG